MRSASSSRCTQQVKTWPSGKMEWLPKHQCVIGAMLHYSPNGGIQPGILQGWLTQYKLYHTAAECLNHLDSYITSGRSGGASCRNLRILCKMLLRPIWIILPSDIKVLQLMKEDFQLMRLHTGSDSDCRMDTDSIHMLWDTQDFLPKSPWGGNSSAE